MVDAPRYGLPIWFRNMGGKQDTIPILSGKIDCWRHLLGGYWSVLTHDGRRLVLPEEMFLTKEEVL